MDADSPSDKTPFKSSFFRRFLFGIPRVRTEEELQEIINASEEEGIINEDEGEMLHSIFEFGETIVREIMVSRTDMISCSTDATVADLLKAIIDSGHSRIPIFEGSNDRIVGLVYAKDLLKYWGCPEDEITISEVIRPPLFVPETKKIEELLKEFKLRRVHMAIAIDEYGGTSGLVTIGDLLEEIVGDIQDEYDLEEEWLKKEDDSVLVDCRLNIEEFAEYFQVTIPRERFDTVAGWLFDLLGHVPLHEEEIVYDNLVIQVMECDERKIRRVRVKPAAPAELNGDEG